MMKKGTHGANNEEQKRTDKIKKSTIYMICFSLLPAYQLPVFLEITLVSSRGLTSKIPETDIFTIYNIYFTIIFQV